MKKILLILLTCSFLMCGCSSFIKKTPWELNQSFNVENYCNITLKQVMVVDEFKQLNFFLHEPNENSKYLCAIFNIENLTSSEKYLLDFINVRAKYNNKQKYDVLDWDNPTITTLTPMDIAAVIEIPNKVADDLAALSLEITFNEQRYTYDGEIYDISEYIQTIKEVADNLGKTITDFISFFSTAQLNLSFDPINTAEKLRLEVKKCQPTISDISATLHNLTPINYYAEAHNKLIEFSDAFLEFFASIGVDYSINQSNIREYGNTIKNASNFISDKAALPKEILNVMTFLEDTEFRQL